MLLTELEERFIAEALARTGGNRNRAAELLGLNRTTLDELVIAYRALWEAVSL